MPRLTPGRAVAAAALVGALLAVVVHRLAPTPTADVSKGSEEAFGAGLYQRELPPRQRPIRWTTPRAVFRFRFLPPGPAVLEVAIHGQRGPAVVAVDGLVLGALEPGTPTGRFPLTVGPSERIDVELRSEGPVTDSRRLGAQLDRVSVLHASPRLPSLGLVAAFLLPAIVASLAALMVGVGPWSAFLAASCLAAIQGLLGCASGAVRSPYFVTLSILLAGSAAAAGLFAWWARRWGSEFRPHAFLALLSACVVQGVLATTPLMVVSDAVFHANKLAAVAQGDLFPTSRTQHAQPFLIPYGATFYALLAPFHKLGCDPVSVVRHGAALSGIAASAGLFVLIATQRTPLVAALAVIVLQLLPGTFAVYSFGNLSNVFGQAVTLLFFAWWSGGRPGGWLLGGLLVAMGATAHLSSLIVLAAVVMALVLARGREARRDRTGLLAAGLGFALAMAYYAHYSPLIREQLPRLLEGGRELPSASSGLLGSFGAQLVAAVGHWGWPMSLLALTGLGRVAQGPGGREWTAYALGCGALLIPAVVSPAEVRYLYALGPFVAVSAVVGVLRAWRSGHIWRLAAGVLAAWSVGLGVSGIAEAVLTRYR
jgi:hypothetical protein